MNESKRPRPVARRSLLAAVCLTLSSAGCLGGSASSTSDPNPDHVVAVKSHVAVTLTVRIWVVRAKTDETVFETTREIASGGHITVYNTEQADPEGVERFEICAEIVDAAGTTAEPETTATPKFEEGTTVPWDEFGEGDSRGCYTMRTDECTGDLAVVLDDRDSLRFMQGVC